MLKWNDRFPFVFFSIILVFIFLAGDGIRIVQYPPRSFHMFRQSDCLAYTKTYYQHKTGFFAPATYNLIGNDGRVVSEFPVLYYLSAQLCKLLGFHYWIIRGVTFLCYFFGAFCLLLITNRWIRNPVLAYFPVIILATAPYYFYYAVNFLPNVPAISFSFIGLYYLLRFTDNSRTYNLVLGTLFFIVAALLKPTDGGLIWAAMTGVLTFSFFTKVGIDVKIKPILISSLCVILASAGWYYFVKQYNLKYGNTINLQGIYPIWDMIWGDVLYVYNERIMGIWRDTFQHPVLLLISGGCLISFCVKWNRLDRFLRLFTLFLLIGTLVYIPLWYKAFSDHDYYQLIFVIPAFFLSVTMIEYYERCIVNRISKETRYTINIVLVALMIICVYHNQFIQLGKYSDNIRNYNNVNIHEVEPYLRKFGVTEDDIVLSVPDGTPNITLAAYGNRGFASDLFEKGLFNVEYCQQRGAHYMIITDASYIYDSAYVAYTSKLVGQYKDIYVFDIR